MRHRSLLSISRGRRCREEVSSSSTGTPSPTTVGMSSGSSTASSSSKHHRLHRFRGLGGCAGTWCKPQVLPTDTMGPMSVSAIASEMLERGWVTREEHTQLLLGDRLYRLHQAVQQQERQRKEGLVRKLSKRSGLGFGQCVRSRSKARKCHKSVAAASKPPKAKVSVEKKKPERPADPCRDPITLDDLGSWTWDFRACEAATPPVSCGGTMPSKAKWSGDSCRGRGRRGDSVGGGGGGGGGGGKGGNGGSGSGGGGWGAGGGGSGGSSSAVVTYNVESLVLYLLESGDFQEPTTRRPFSLVQLADLDALAAKAGAKVKGSLVTSYHEGQSKYRERRERREMLVGADRCLGDIVSEMLSTIEDSDEPYEEAHLYLVTLFPQFAHIFSEMKQVDEEFARQCLQQQTAHLRGPPNRPTAGSLTCEQEGLLRTALEFLNEQARAGGGGGSSDDVGRQVERSDRDRADGDRASRGQEASGDEGGTSGDDAGSGESGA